MPDQLVFEWPAHEGLGAEDFFVSDANEHAVAMLRAPENWPEQKLILLGPEASGKSHLARIFQDQHGASLFRTDDVTPRAEGDGAVIVEDADQIAAERQEALFHLHNNLRAERRALLLTASAPPSRWELSLPDLASRMQATTTAQIEPPDDTLLQVLLTKHFSDRQIMPAPNVINYVATRIERSYTAAKDIADQLDRAALAQKKPVSMKMAAAILDK